jgi:transcriptional regulator with XRE-family HTH domain
VASSEIGTTLRDARERRGWTREALAYHARVSWAAIAQIESGRRKDVRLSTLSALAAALEISVDQLIAPGGELPPPPQPQFRHRVLVFGSDDEFVAATVGYLAAGVQSDERPLVVTTKERTRLLRDALAEDATEVQFALSSQWYRTPSHALGGYRDYLDESLTSGARAVRVVGEPVWTGRSPAAVKAWTRYESLINLVFAASPATIVCPYDRRSVPAAVIRDARRTHPEIAATGKTQAARSTTYKPPEQLLLEP